MDVGILIPAFNEQGTIGDIVAKLRKLGFTKVLVIDDGSTDNTVEVARNEGAEIIRHSVNLGKGSCIKEGLDYFYDRNVDGIVLMDGDGQHNPDEIYRFLNCAEGGQKKLIIGNRMLEHKNMPIHRWITNRVMSFIIFILCGQYIPDTQCGYRFIKKDLLNDIRLATRNYEIESEMVLKTDRKDIKISSVPISTIYRRETSQIDCLMDTLRFLKLIFKFLLCDV